MRPKTPPKIWSVQRKLVPNLLPLMAAAPFWLVAIVIRGWGAGVLVFGGVVVAAVSLNWFGLFGNQTIREELEEKLNPSQDDWYVGIGRPGHKDALDPHEDVGFIRIEGDKATFRGETLEIAVPRSRNLKVRFGWNPHSALFYGRWVVLEDSTAEPPMELRLEPREAVTLLGNRRQGTKLKRVLERWIAG